MMNSRVLNLELDHFLDILSSLRGQNDPSTQLVALEQLCDMLKIYPKDSIFSSIGYLLPPVLVNLAKEHDTFPDVTFLAMKAITYVCDFSPELVAVFVSHGVVPALCQRLHSIEYLDVAEQCLQVLERISEEHSLACFDGGAIMAVLGHIEFFSTDIQLVALSTMGSMCFEMLPIKGPALFMDAVPILSKLLKYKDEEIVKAAAFCINKIGYYVDQPSEIDELCKHDLIENVTYLLRFKDQSVLHEDYYSGLIRLLVKLCSGSVVAFRTLHDLNICSILKDILSSEFPYGTPSSQQHADDKNHCQVRDALALLNQLLPAVTKDLNDPLIQDKEHFLVNRPDLVQKLGMELMEVLPKLIQVFSYDAIIRVSHGCLSVIYKLVYWGKSDMFVEQLKKAAISRFLMEVFTRKDYHVLILALQISELILQKFSDTFLHSFIKEGVFFVIDRLLSPETSSNSNFSEEFGSRESRECLCYVGYSFQSRVSSEVRECKHDKDSIRNLSNHIKAKYLAPELNGSEEGLNDILQNLKILSSDLNNYISLSIDSGLHHMIEERINGVVHQILEIFTTKKLVSIFDLIEIGTVKSLVSYFCAEVKGFSRYDGVPSGDTAHVLIRSLMSALAYLESFPVFLSNGHVPKFGTSFAVVPNNCSVPYPSLKICFIKDKKETCLDNYSGEILTVDPFSTLQTIGEYLWQKGYAEQKQKLYAEAGPKLSFYLEGEKLDYKLTLYQAILCRKIKQKNSFSVDELWCQVHTLKFRRAEKSTVITPPSKVAAYDKCSFILDVFSCKLGSDTKKSNPTLDVLLLLIFLEDSNRFMYHIVSHKSTAAFALGEVDNLDNLKIVVPSVAQNEFVSKNLTDKLEKQMRDSSIVSTHCLPPWFHWLTNKCPFLFSFGARCKYFKLAVYGQPHDPSNENSSMPLSVSGWPHRKVSVSRNLILESAAMMMNLHEDSNKAVFEVNFVGEIGTGHGITTEFYALVSQGFQKYGLGMWREDNCSLTLKKDLQAKESMIRSRYGLFPRPWFSYISSRQRLSEVENRFTLLGQVVAKAIQDGRILDLHLSKAFYKLIIGKDLSLYDIESFDPELGRMLLEFVALVRRKKILESPSGEKSATECELTFRGTRIEDLCLDFTLPGYPDIVLASVPNDSMVTINNLEDYVLLITNATVRSGISRQIEAFKSGFNKVFPITYLHIFTEEELERILCGEQDSMIFNELTSHIEFNHGYTATSPPIVNLLEIIQEFDHELQRAFLQFVTGSPRLPLGGLASLNPKLTVVRKGFGSSADTDLPSVMTCVNYLKLPPYSSKEIMKEKLVYAITEGQQSFHLS